MGLLTDGRKSFKIGLAVLIQYRHYDGQPASRPATSPQQVRPMHICVAQ